MVLRRGTEILFAEGPGEFVRRTQGWCIRSSWEMYHRLLARYLGRTTVRLNGVWIDVNHDVISSNLKRQIRQKSYETPETRLIRSHLDPGIPTIDLGAGIGYTSSLAALTLNKDTPVVAVEPNEELIPALRHTRSLNELEFCIESGAYSSSGGTIEFHLADEFWSSSNFDRSQKQQREVTVPAVSLESILDEHELHSPFQLIVDIEGAEGDLCSNEIDLLQRHCKTMIIELHSIGGTTPEEQDRQLKAHGFKEVDSEGQVRVYENGHFLSELPDF